MLGDLADNRCSGSGREIAGIFEELPDRKSFPDYYLAIKRPISLGEIEVSPAFPRCSCGSFG
jgi:hypothetical protein